MTIRFRSLIAPVEQLTGDGREFSATGGGHRALPLPWMSKFTAGAGHTGAVVVAKVERIIRSGDGTKPGHGWWAEGHYLDPNKVPEVAQAAYLAKEGVHNPSVDLDGDFTVEVRPHPTLPGKQMGRFTRYNMVGVTQLPIAAFSQTRIFCDDEGEKALLASVGLVDLDDEWTVFSVNGESWKAFPVATRDTPYDADGAVQRIAAWAGIGSSHPDVSKYASAFLWRDGSQTGDSFAQDSFRLPVIDIINGQPHLIYHAAYAAAALISGAHGGLPNIPDSDKQHLAAVIQAMYQKFRTAFNDPGMPNPFGAGDPNRGNQPAKGAAMDIDPIQELAPAKMPYGDVTYADPGYQDDGKKRYPIDSAEHVRAAWSYINQADNSGMYSTEQLNSIKARIRTAAKKYGVQIADANPAMGLSLEEFAAAQQAMMAAPAGASAPMMPALDTPEHCQAAWDMVNDPAMANQHSPVELAAMKAQIKAAAAKLGYTLTGPNSAKTGPAKPPPHVGGTPTGAGYALEPGPDEWDTGEELPALLASVAPVAPPRAWFADPQFTGPSPLTITDDGRVFGHLAEWRKCHVGIGDQCVVAPHSRTDYAMFRLGPVACDDGSQIKVGKITLGTGHAHPQWGIVPSRNHYDNSGWAAAVVNVGEDKFGIWVAGALTANMTPERIAELRRSPLSGDWRRVNGNLELIAALAVNSPGFPVLHVNQGHDFSLVAAGVVQGFTTEDLELETESERASRLAQILADADEHAQAKRAARFAAITTGEAVPTAPGAGSDASSLARQLDAFFTILANANDEPNATDPGHLPSPAPVDQSAAPAPGAAVPVPAAAPVQAPPTQ